MPVTPTHPGVYIEELPSGVRTINGVATSIAAFVGFFRRGPMDRAVQLFNMGDFERVFGGLDSLSEASYAVQQFFANGGPEAWVVRSASGAVSEADVDLETEGGVAAMTVTAIHPGAWGNDLRVTVDYPEPTSGGSFNLTVALVEDQGGVEVVSAAESFNGLTVANAEATVNDEFTGSKLIRLSDVVAVPAASGTMSGDLSTFPAITDATPEVAVEIAGVSATALFSEVPNTVTEARGVLEEAIRAASPATPAFAQAAVSVVDGRLRVVAGPSEPDAVVLFSDAGADATATEMILTGAGSSSNVQVYELGQGAVAGTAQAAGAAGADGSPPDATALIGSLAARTGFHALEAVDLFNILAIPRAALVSGTNALADADPDAASLAIHQAALDYCTRRRAFYLVDPPNNLDEVQEVKDWFLASGLSASTGRNGALYFPRVELPDPLDDFRLRAIGASGTIAGLYARTDATRGVWKAPAGTEASLNGVLRLEAKLSDSQNGALNPLAINVLRDFPVFGRVAWGARTLVGADQQASEWKYVPVRRLALFLEESLYRGTQWVVFEPNDEPLWAQIRLNLGAFMQSLFLQGAFQGSKPRDAYLIKCDAETTTQDDINRGIVNIIVGFAPLKPAEFVILKIQQLAGRLEA